MKSLNNRNISTLLALIFFIFSLGSRAQSSIGDSIISFYGKSPFAYYFLYNYYSANDGLTTTTGRLSGYKQQNKMQFRLRLDSITSFSSKEYMGDDYVDNSKFSGCNYSDSSYEDLKQNNEQLRQKGDSYIPDYILEPDTFRSLFSNHKRYLLSVNRMKEYIIIQVTDTNLYDRGLAMMRKFVRTYIVSKKDYRVLRYAYDFLYLIDNVSFRDSAEFIYGYSKKMGQEIADDISSFSPFKKIVRERTVNPQDTITLFPAFSLPDASHKMYASARSAAKYTLVEFWYKSCGPCLKNIRKLSSVRDSVSPSLLDIVAINDFDLLDDKLIKFINQFNANYTILFNGEGLRKRLSIRAHPSTYIYNTETRKVVYYEKGTSDDYAEKIIRHMKHMN